MEFSLQPHLRNHRLELKPLTENHFEALYMLASDPLVWAQHPNNERYKREVFENFFKGALLSNGAFTIIDVNLGQAVGCTRFYDYDAIQNSIFIGYTFYGRSFWGKNYNSEVKKLMLDYIFQYVSVVFFHVGKENFRSRRAMEKLGAENCGEIEVAYFGEASKTNIVYQIEKEKFLR